MALVPCQPTAALLPRIAAGDAAAFGGFYDAWFPAALALARTIARRDESFGMDVVQDVMCKVADAPPQAEDDDAVAAWMSRAIWTATIDRLRAEHRRARRETTVASLRPERSDDTPWLSALANERLSWLQAQLAALPAAEAALLQARFGDASTLAATGARFGLSGDAAHGRIRRVLLRLRQAAKEWFADE